MAPRGAPSHGDYGDKGDAVLDFCSCPLVCWSIDRPVRDGLEMREKQTKTALTGPTLGDRTAERLETARALMLNFLVAKDHPPRAPATPYSRQLPIHLGPTISHLPWPLMTCQSSSSNEVPVQLVIHPPTFNYSCFFESECPWAEAIFALVCSLRRVLPPLTLIWHESPPQSVLMDIPRLVLAGDR